MKNVFSTALLDQLYAKRNLQLEQERQALLAKIIQWLNEFGDRYGITTAYIFGSITQPQKFTQKSDIDIAVEQININDLFAVIGFVSEAVGRDVDVIEINKCHFANQIRQSGILWTTIN